MNKTSKIYIAGHTGLVGSAIKRKLEGKGYSNLVLRTHAELDLTRQTDVERFFEKEQPDYVFLAAAKVGGILANSTYKAEFIYDNIMIASNIIHASHKSGVKKLLNLGSSCIYPKFAPQPLKEEYLLTGALEPTNEPYAIAKIAAIKLCRYYNEQYGTNFISAMPTNLYGPNDNFDLQTSHVLPALIRKMHLGKCLGVGDIGAIREDLKKYPLRIDDVSQMEETKIIEELAKYGIKTNYESRITPHESRITNHASQSVVVQLWGTGAPYREFLHVDDLACACLFLMETLDASRFTDHGSRLTTHEFINIGTGKDLTIKELANLVKEIIGFDGEILWDTSKADGTPRKLLDVSRIKSFGWQPKIGLKEGIRKTYNWYLSQNT
jgi:Nucleoside-diphosphate-sugar epimerases